MSGDGPRDADDRRDEETGGDDASLDPEADEPSEGYAWGFARQERDLPANEYRAHVRLLDETDEEEIDAVDLSGASDYILWAAAQAFEDLERYDEAMAILRRLAATKAPHPALYYPEILLRLVESLKDRGDYDEALEILGKVEALDPETKERCDERRAEILVLRGEAEKGLRLFRETARAFPDDPWVALRAAWALLASGRYADVPDWIRRSEKALKEVEDEGEARAAAAEIDRVRQEAEAREARRARAGTPGAGAVAGLLALKEEILAALDAEEARLTRNPPRTEEARARATERLAALRDRASQGWDDAVEAGDETLIADLDELQWDVVGVAERFGLELP